MTLDLSGLQNLAHRLAAEALSTVAPGAIFLLDGPMGAGKTQFTRYFIESLAPQELEVASPTFAFHHRHLTASARIDHFDLYRIQSVEELESIGFWDFFARKKTSIKRMILIEWSNRLTELNAEKNLPAKWSIWKLDFKELNETYREITVIAPKF